MYAYTIGTKVTKKAKNSTKAQMQENNDDYQKWI